MINVFVSIPRISEGPNRFNFVHSIPQRGWMGLLNLPTLTGIQVNGAKAAQKLAFCHTIICDFTSTFLWKLLAERKKFDPRNLLLCMTMNKSVHKMLIHGTLGPLSRGKKCKLNRNFTTSHL